MKELQLLPADLAAKSLSPIEIVLPYKEVLEAIVALTAQGYFVFAWEGWVKYPDGRHGHSRLHQGTHDFWGTKGQSTQERLKEVALYAEETIDASQRAWNDNPEVTGGTLYFCLTIETAARAPQGPFQAP